MRDFWLSCGHHLVDRDADGRLLPTDAFIKAYFARPELVPPAEACRAEHALHADLLLQPCRHVDADRIAAIADPDARENWDRTITFRDHLLRQGSLEAAYLDLMRHGVDRTPPMFIAQLVHLILRNALDECEDPFMLRAAELFFRSQCMTTLHGSLIAADQETVTGMGPLSPLVSMLGIPAAAGIDVLNDDNADSYWNRSDAFDMAIDLTAGRRGLAALGDVMVRWISHMLAIDVTIEPLIEMREVDLTWYVGLDAAGTGIGNALWNGEDVDAESRTAVVGLYRLAFNDSKVAIESVESQPAYLILARSRDNMLRMKPQNLLMGLPLRQLETVN
jgi:hypothetical protein